MFGAAESDVTPVFALEPRDRLKWRGQLPAGLQIISCNATKKSKPDRVTVIPHSKIS
jgi:hypothetical protein